MVEGPHAGGERPPARGGLGRQGFRHSLEDTEKTGDSRPAGSPLEWPAMRVVDLDRDMRDVIPTGTSPDSEFLFDRMTDQTLGDAVAGGRRILDVASGFGQDARRLAGQGAFAVAAEPSARMSALAKLQEDESSGPHALHVRAWGDALPFADGAFDAVFCKGAIDHFDTPTAAIGEMARVTRAGGRVVLAIANFESLSCRLARGLDGVREDWLGRTPPRGRRHYDVPHDHFTRYDLAPGARAGRTEHLRVEVLDRASRWPGGCRAGRAWVSRLPDGSSLSPCWRVSMRMARAHARSGRRHRALAGQPAPQSRVRAPRRPRRWRRATLGHA